MVRSTVAMATSLGLDVVAEGVETPPSRRALADAGCQWAQGWLFSAAVPGPRLPEVLARLEADAVPLDALAAPAR